MGGYGKPLTFRGTRMDRTAEHPPAVLVVDDDAITWEGLAAILGRAGYDVAQAGNGAEALAYLRGNPAPAVVLLDMFMPGVDGWRFLDALRREPALAGVPVVVATATILTREWAQSHGCAGFLRKPFSAESLLDEVARCVGRSG